MALCECGCGRETSIAKNTKREYGHVKGQPVRFVTGHANRGRIFPHRWANADAKWSLDTNGCWVWREGLTSSGYATLKHAGKSFRAARWFYKRAKGQIADGMTIDHLCRNRACVNPDHLEAVTQTENKRRGVKAHLTDERVDHLRKQHASGESVKGLARRTGVAETTIRRVISGQQWRGTGSTSGDAATAR